MTEILSPSLSLYLAFLVARVTSCVRRLLPPWLFIPLPSCPLTVAKIVKLEKSVWFICPHLIIRNYDWVYWEGLTLAAPLTIENELMHCLGGLAGGPCLLVSTLPTSAVCIAPTSLLTSMHSPHDVWIPLVLHLDMALMTPIKCFAWRLGFICRGAILING